MSWSYMPRVARSRSEITTRGVYRAPVYSAASVNAAIVQANTTSATIELDNAVSTPTPITGTELPKKHATK